MSKPGDKTSDQVEMALSLVPVYINGPHVPKPIHKVFFTGLGDEVSLDVGFFDLREVFDLVNYAREQRAKNAAIPPRNINVFITDRFFLSANAALELLKTAENIVRHFQKRKLLPENLASIKDDPMVLRFDFER